MVFLGLVEKEKRGQQSRSSLLYRDSHNDSKRLPTLRIDSLYSPDSFFAAMQHQRQTVPCLPHSVDCLDQAHSGAIRAPAALFLHE
jgi:hypothetical protein